MNKTKVKMMGLKRDREHADVDQIQGSIFDSKTNKRQTGING